MADALSRHPEERLLLLQITAPKSLDIDDLARQVSADGDCAAIITQLQRGELREPDCTFGNGLLYKNQCLVILKLLHQFHASMIGGHEGVLKIFKRLSKEVYWKGMHKDVVDFITYCQVCQTTKYSTLSPAGLIFPLPILEQIWTNISLDFIDGLPVLKGFDFILVVVDSLSKYGHFIPLKHPYTATTVSDAYIKKVVRLHGFPETMVSDRDTVFLSNFWSELFRTQGT